MIVKIDFEVSESCPIKGGIFALDSKSLKSLADSEIGQGSQRVPNGPKRVPKGPEGSQKGPKRAPKGPKGP